MIIVEGPDLAGKTRFCELLAKTSKYDRRHLGPPVPGVVRDFGFYTEGASLPIIQDRWHLSEWVYQRMGIIPVPSSTHLCAESELLRATEELSHSALIVTMVHEDSSYLAGFYDGMVTAGLREEAYDKETVLKTNQAFRALCDFSAHLNGQGGRPRFPADIVMKVSHGDWPDEGAARWVLEMHAQRVGLPRTWE